MHFYLRALRVPPLVVFLCLAAGACQPEGGSAQPPAGSAGSSGLGGARAGGSSGGAGSGGATVSGSGGDLGTTGGAVGSGGTTSGGAISGGTTSGGAISGGTTSGGAISGGTTSGGAVSGGTTSGGGGAAGANAGAAAGGAANSGCGSRNDLLFCEDFEKLAAGPMPNGGVWSTSYIGPDAPSITIDTTTPAHSGARSLVVRAPDANFQSFLSYHDASALPRAQKEFYLRCYVRMGRDMASGHNAYLILDRMAAPGAGAAVRLGEQAAMLSLTVGGDSHGTLSNSKFSQDQVVGPHFVAQKWACLEGYFNSARPEIDFWLDGAEIGDFHHTDWPADDYDTVRFGFEKYAGPALEIWFDDIAIGAARIGCQ